MTTVVVPRPVRDIEFSELCRAHMVEPVAVARYGDSVAYTFNPDLTGDQLATVAIITRFCRASFDLSYEEFAALAPAIVSLGTYRTRTPAEWSALTAAQRDSALVDWCQSITDVLRAIVRD